MGDQNKAVTIYKMENTRFADIQLSQIDIRKLTEFHVQRLTDSEREEWEEKKSKYSSFGQHHGNNGHHGNIHNGHNHNNYNHSNGNNRARYQKKAKQPNHGNRDKSLSSPRDQQQVNQPMMNQPAIIDAVRNDEPQFDENEGQQQPVRMLLKNKGNRGNVFGQQFGGNQNVSNNVKKVNLENKQEKYNKMKEKIFSGVSSPKNEKNNNVQNEKESESKNNE